MTTTYAVNDYVDIARRMTSVSATEKWAIYYESPGSAYGFSGWCVVDDHGILRLTKIYEKPVTIFQTPQDAHDAMIATATWRESESVVRDGLIVKPWTDGA